MKFGKIFKHKSKNKDKNKLVNESFECTYHGWVMIPIDLGDGKKLEYKNNNAMLKIGRKVAKSQLDARKEGIPSNIQMNSKTGISILNKAQGSQPLLHATINTITNVLVIPDLQCCSLMCFTHDPNNVPGIGCDVIRFDKNLTEDDLSDLLQKFNSTLIDVFQRNRKEAPVNVESKDKVSDLPDIKKSLNLNEKRRSSVHSSMIPTTSTNKNRESVDLSGTDGGYLTVDMVNSILNEADEDDESSKDNTEGGYLVVHEQEICLPYENDESIDEGSKEEVSTKEINKDADSEDEEL